MNRWTLGCVPLRWSGSGSVIRDHSNHGRSNEPMNPLWKRIHWFIWSAMIRVITAFTAITYCIRWGKDVLSNTSAWVLKVPDPACSSFLWIEELRTSEKVYQELFTSKKKEESKRKVLLVTWKMPKLVKHLAQKQWCDNHDASSRQVIVLKPLFCSLY